MNVKDQLKILDNKIRQNQADYDLYRKNDKISALSSGKLDKYEYLTDEDLGYRPDPVQKAKSEYSPLCQVFNKGLNSSEKQEGLLKRLKNIEDKTDDQLKAIEGQKDNQPSLKSIGYSVKNRLPKKVIEAYEDLVKKDKTINYKKLGKDLGGDEYDFTMLFPVGELFKQLYHGNILIPGAEREQDEFYDKLKKLKKYTPANEKTISKKESFLNNIQQFYDGREMVINAFKSRIIPLADGSYSQHFEKSN